MGALYVALLHGDVVDKTGEEIASSLTHFDVHDIARSCRTYGVKQYFVVTPLETMRYLAQRMISYWNAGLGTFTVPNRKDALEVVQVEKSLADAVDRIRLAEGHPPYLLATSAKVRETTIPYGEAYRWMTESERPVLLLFGTAYGLAGRIIEQCDATLPPIRAGRWNHLSVRSAVAITLERVVGEEQTD